MEVAIGTHKTNVSPVDVARMVASLYGFYDVDIETVDEGRVRLTATGHKRSVRINGSTVSSACESFINKMIGEKNE